MNRKRKQRIRNAIFSLAMTFVLVVGSAVGALAASEGGAGGDSYSNTNEVAQKLPLAEVWIDPSFFYDVEMSPEIVKAGGTTEKPLIYYDKDTKQVGINRDILIANESNDFSEDDAEWRYTFQEAATFPDGSKGNVTVTFTFDRVEVGWHKAAVGAVIPCRAVLTDGRLQTGNNAGKGIHFKANTPDSDKASCWSFKAFVDTVITVSGGSGDFIVGGTGANVVQAPDKETSAWYANYGRNADYTRESFTLADSNVYYPTTNYSIYDSADGKVTIYKNKNITGGSNRTYGSGFVTEGNSAGFAVQLGVIGGVNASYGPQSNDMFITLGDMQHRIWSGSGPGGSINTYKNGSGGDVLPGGTFTGDIPSDFPVPAAPATSDTLKRYVVPDYKKGVTYEMTPKKGYTLEKVVVDGNEYIAPDTPEPTATIASSDGDGTLKYLGGGKFSYSFDKENTKDHEIYVTWKKQTADIEVYKKWNDNSKASAVTANVKLVSDESPAFEETKPVPTSDGLVYKWTVPVYKYDDKGDATTAVTYKLSEISDPVSSDYAKAVWAGADYEGGTADGGFTLTDPKSETGVRAVDDPYKATVTNTLSKDVEITKIWVDGDNKYNTRPTDVGGMFKLYNAADDKEVTGITPTVTSEGASSDKVKWSGLPALDENKKPITYYAKETAPTGYKSTPEDGKVSEDGTITNTLETTAVEITKKWDDNGDAAGKRPAFGDMSKSFTLYDKAGGTVVSQEVEEMGQVADVYFARWFDLPKYNSSGEEINYLVKETTVPDGYKITEGADGVGHRGTITNKYTDTTPTWIDGGPYKTKDTVGKTQKGTLTFKSNGSKIVKAKLIDPNTGKETDATQVDVYQNGKKVGTYKLNPTGKTNADGSVAYEITFTPVGNYTGTPPSVKLRVYDENGNYADGVYQPQVTGTTPADPSKGGSPTTGDPNTPGMWAVLFVSSFLLMLLALRSRRSR